MRVYKQLPNIILQDSTVEWNQVEQHILLEKLSAFTSKCVLDELNFVTKADELISEEIAMHVNKVQSKIYEHRRPKSSLSRDESCVVSTHLKLMKCQSHTIKYSTILQTCVYFISLSHCSTWLPRIWIVPIFAWLHCCTSWCPSTCPGRKPWNLRETAEEYYHEEKTQGNSRLSQNSSCLRSTVHLWTTTISWALTNIFQNTHHSGS